MTATPTIDAQARIAADYATAKDVGARARELAADSMARRRPFLGVYGVRDILMGEGYSETWGHCAGLVYVYTIKAELALAGHRRDCVPCDRLGYIAVTAAR